jgi:hypothetical protein
MERGWPEFSGELHLANSSGRSPVRTQASTSRDPYDDRGLGRHRLPCPCNAHGHARARVRDFPGPSSPRGIPSPADSGHSVDGTNMLPSTAVARSDPQPICSGSPGEPSSPPPTRTQAPEGAAEAARHVSAAA